MYFTPSKIAFRALWLLLFASTLLALAQTSTQTTVSVLPANPTTADSISFIGTVSPSGACSASTSGFIFFYSGPNLSNGQYQVPVACPTYTIGKLAAGAYTLYGAYLGTPGVQNGVPFGYLGSTSSTISFTVAAPCGSAGPALQGQYAFLFQGLAFGGPATALGSFTADGQGNITAGVVDLATSSGSLRREAVTGTYSLDLSGRGMLTLTSATLGKQTFSLATQDVQAGSTVTTASVTPYGGALAGSAQVTLQTPASFGSTGQYLLNLTGAAGNPATTLLFETGTLTISGTGTRQAAGVVDQTVGGTVTQGVTFTASTGAVDGTTGLFGITSLAITSPTTAALPVLSFDAVQINAQHLFVMETVPASHSFSVLSGTASQ